MWFDDVKRMTETLVELPSVSPNAQAENRIAQAMGDMLRDGSGLAPEMWPTGDGRHSVACLLRGEHPSKGAQTVILMGHFDTVGVDEFRALDGEGDGLIAFRPDALKAALLARGALPEANPDEWMVGRGALDMKSGLAAQIAVLRQLWRERDELVGNVLLLACPDEESESAGILAALPRLIALRDEYKLDYVGIINADYTAPRSKDDAQHARRYIYSGTVGKLLPAFYIIGDPTHVGEPFRGVDAAHIAAEVVRHLTLNAELADHWPGDGNLDAQWAVPPVALHMRDLKPVYNVQTASEAFVYANWLTLNRSPDEALQMMMGVARTALGAVMRWRDEQYRKFEGDQPAPQTYEQGGAVDFEYLCQIVKDKQGWDAAALDVWLDEIASNTSPPDRASLGLSPSPLTERGWRGARTSTEAGVRSQADGEQPMSAIDSRQQSLQIVRQVASKAGIAGPALIVFFAPPYYPHIQPANDRLSNALEHVLATQPSSAAIERRAFYPYISDLSYVRLDDTVHAAMDALRANMPLLGRGYHLDLDAMAALDCAVINIGPWGKDAHGLLERVHMPYAFQVLPQLIYDTVKVALAE